MTANPATTGTTTTSGPQAVEDAHTFAGLNLVGNETLFGQDQDVEPADAQIAVSPWQLLEVAGNTMAGFDIAGNVQWSVDLRAFFGLPAGYIYYGSSLQFDYKNARWFLGGIASNTAAHTSWVLLAVSRSADAFGGWFLNITEAIPNNPSQCSPPCPNDTYYMRESIAVTDDKVIQARQAEGPGSVARFNGFLVMRKDQLMSGALSNVDRFDLGSGQADFLAVQPQSLGTRGYLVWLKAGCVTCAPDRLGLLEVVGVPAPDRITSFSGSTAIYEIDYSTNMPPVNVFPAQPGGSLHASPTPITSAIYRDGIIALALNDTCGPGAPNQLCVRVFKTTQIENATLVATDSQGTLPATPPLRSADLEHSFVRYQADLFDASLAIDPYHNLFVTTAFSSQSAYPGLALTGISSPITAASTLMPVSPILEGPSSYNCFAGGNNAWGAYMRSVPDANNWTHVWAPGEVAVNGCWATTVTSATMGVAPQFTSLAPTYGSTKGGQVVEIHGAYFVPGDEQVMFGNTASTILAESSTTILVSTPSAGASGAVSVTVQTPDGSANAGTFTYITPGIRVIPPSAPPVPFRR